MKSKVVLRIGMLWRGNKEDKSMYDTIGHAAAYYFSKFGKVPQFCHVHPDSFGGKWPKKSSSNMIIKPDKSILPNHVWLGVIKK